MVEEMQLVQRNQKSLERKKVKMTLHFWTPMMTLNNIKIEVLLGVLLIIDIRGLMILPSVISCQREPPPSGRLIRSVSWPSTSDIVRG